MIKAKNKAVALGFSLILVATLAIAGCGNSSNSSDRTANAKNGILTIASDAGSTNQFQRNWNFNGGSATTGPGIPLIYEPLYAYSPRGVQEPRLAESLPVYSTAPYPKAEIDQYHKDLNQYIKEQVKAKDPSFATPELIKAYKEKQDKSVAKGMGIVDIKLRTTNWSDGVPFTAKDVAFNLNNGWISSGICNNIWNCYLHQPVAAKPGDPHTVRIVFNGIHYDQRINGLVVPEHTWNKAPTGIAPNGNPADQGKKTGTVKVWQLDKFVDKNPVGTGPGKLISYAGGKVRFQWRDDYYLGKPKDIKEIDFVPAGMAAQVQAAVTKGSVDWAEGSINKVQTVFVNKSKDNHYFYFPNGGSRAIFFGATKNPTNDLAVRKALTMSVDLTLGQKAADIGYAIPNIEGYDPETQKDWIVNGYDKSITPNADEAKKVLKDAGWSVNSQGNLEKDGKEYPLELWTSNTEKAEDLVIMPTIIEQWKLNLGLIVKYNPTGDTPYQAGKQKFQYQMYTDNLGGDSVNPASMWAGFSHYNLAYNWSNQGRFKVTDEIDKLIASVSQYPLSDKAALQDLGKKMGAYFIDQAAYLPYEENGLGIMWSTKNYVNWPSGANAAHYPYISTSGGANDNMIQVILGLKAS